MRLENLQDRQQLLELVSKEIKGRLPAEQAQAICKFAGIYLETMPLEEVEGRRLSDIYGAILACWHFLQHHDPETPKVAVFNPDLEVHGWQSTHSVVAILHRNIPFIVDSIRMALNRMSLRIYSIQHSVLYIQRDAKFNLLEIRSRDEEHVRELAEALMFVEIDRHSNDADLREIEEELHQILFEVRVAVGDYRQMREIAAAVPDALPDSVPGQQKTDIKEVRDFFHWLIQDNFTFLGYEEYDYLRKGKEVILQQRKGSELGILKSQTDRPDTLKLARLPASIRKRLDSDAPVVFAKAPERSRVHRPAYPDFVALREYDAEGKAISEKRFIGLYTSKVFQSRLEQIPIVRRKADYVLKKSGFNADDYAGKELEQILAVYPRDELFQISRTQLLEIALSVLSIQERRKIKLYLREGIYGQFVNALVYVPRDLYSTDLRIRISNILVAATDATDVDFTTYFSESVLARTQFCLKVPVNGNRSLNARELETKIIAAAQSWQDQLVEGLSEAHGEESANNLSHRYLNAFTGSYRERFSPRRAVVDIDHLSRLSPERPLSMSFYRSLEEPDAMLHFKLFHIEHQVPLSDVLPLFENLGLRVMGEHPYETRDRAGQIAWIHDFSLESADGSVINIQMVREHFEELFNRVWRGDAENDVFNRLVVSAHMDWREIAMFRAYARYMRQIRFSYSQDFIANTLVQHGQIATALLQLFDARLNPASVTSEAQCEAAQTKLELEINEALDQVSNLSEDRVIRRYVELIKATLRTNYYQRDEAGELKSYISFKISPARVSNMPLPLPMFEIFVYSPRVEGVHLRGGKVARGGLRWSDRFEDFRTEVLGLVKAQQVKNSVIVPVGAKGGFVARQLPDGDREAVLAEGIACYKTFIRALLDITDNLVGGAVVPPPQVVRHDEDDYYLVVAADKGTATFSDIANGLAAEYDFWLGDAFASGGSQGYDHKKMGITARGAWVSVQRHFREIGLNTQTEAFTVTGIGDMSGDVFGNGLLMSRTLKLVAAFNHLHIFIDPDPDPERSFEERKRLFELPRSNWTDYDRKLISKGGGIFERSLKSISITPEMKALLGVRQDRMPPNMLIAAILKAKVDLLWIGGIGTYVKSTKESNTEVGDKSNDALRINGEELGAKVVGEGGNLGMTQLGRIEFSRAGGRLNTDFIDNAGGVDCSDHEVNIKILLNEIVKEGDMTLKQRNKLLVDMTDEVAGLVLQNNYRQTQALSNAVFEASNRVEEYRRLINHLEAIGKLNRELEFIPDDETITERKSRGLGLMRPELCVLLSYVKGLAKEELMASAIVDDESLEDELYTEFPERLQKKFPEALKSHRLRREIIATQLANDMVNHMGITFVERLRQSTGGSLPSIAQAYVIARDVFCMSRHWRAIEALDYHVPTQMQVRMMLDLARLVRRATRWFLRNRRRELNVLENMGRFRSGIQLITGQLDQFLAGQQLIQWQEAYQAYKDAGADDALARTIAGCPYLYSALGIIEAKERSGLPLEYVAEAFFKLGEALDLHWFAHQLSLAKPSSHWQALARESFREDLDWQQRSITIGLLTRPEPGAEEMEPIEQRIAAWRSHHAELIHRWEAMLTELKAAKDPEFSMYSVALRELLDIAQDTTHTVAAEEISPLPTQLRAG